MDEFTLEEEYHIIHTYGKCTDAKIISSNFLIQYFTLGNCKFIIRFKKIKDYDEFGDLYEMDMITRFYNFKR